MVIKLIQIHSEDPIKITLSPGENSFGRGKLLGCNDKRISRNHGELHVFEDYIELKALHQNPCFYTKKDTDNKEILKKDSIISLSNGDRFGLLPDAFWYEVVHCTHNESQETEKEDLNTEEYIEQTVNRDETVNVSSPESPSIISQTSDEVNSHNPTAQSDVNKPAESDKGTVKRCHGSDEESSSSEISKKVKTEPTAVETEPMEVKTVTAAIETEPTEVKTEPAVVETEPTEVKTEPAAVETEPTEVKTEHTHEGSSENNSEPAVKQEPNDTPEPSVNQAANNNGAAINPNVNRPPRERCMYGANCYRRNPSHFVQFSHPSDGDWGAGAQSPCPFGVACVRRDPRHYRDHTHPPGHRPPPPPGKRKRRGSSYSPPPGVLQRLRKRKQRITDSLSDDSEETDPYGTDESDEWKPETGDSQLSEDIA